VLLLDLDPQGNATMGCGVDKSQLARGGTLEVLLGETTIDSALIKMNWRDFAPAIEPGSHRRRSAIARDEYGARAQLKNALAAVQGRFDVIVIDSPPALNLLTVNALVAADSVLIPMQCEYALEGLSALLATIEQIKAAANPALAIEVSAHHVRPA